MGSLSDKEIMVEAATVLREFDIPYEIGVYSAHRTPARSAKLASEAAGRGVKVLIAGAGAAAHLAGAFAAHSTLPVIGVPLAATSLGGMDALLATVQMPAGFPSRPSLLGKRARATRRISRRRFSRRRTRRSPKEFVPSAPKKRKKSKKPPKRSKTSSSPVKKSRFCSRRKFGGQVQGRCDSAERPS